MPGLVGTTLDSYRLVDQIGQGGMSTVHRAIDTRTQQEVAVKALAPTISSDKRFVRRFRREADLLFRLRHPNIVPVTDYGESKGVVYLVMPLVLGDTLSDRLIQQRISVQDLSRWVSQVSDALQFAHDQGVIHRDIKPANVMINRTGNALLTDFGLARLAEGSHSLTGSMLMGTPGYISPEQGRGQTIDARSDQYALGVILYQIAAGRLPFEGENPMSTVLMHIQEPLPPIRRFNKDVSPALERVIAKVLAKDPDDRFPNVAALNAAYQVALTGGADAEGQATQVIPAPRRVAVGKVQAPPRTGSRLGVDRRAGGGRARAGGCDWMAEADGRRGNDRAASGDRAHRSSCDGTRRGGLAHTKPRPDGGSDGHRVGDLPWIAAHWVPPQRGRSGVDDRQRHRRRPLLGKHSEPRMGGPQPADRGPDGRPEDSASGRRIDRRQCRLRNPA
jgi:hypothetical protein